MILSWQAPGPYTVAFSTRAGGVSEGPYESLNLGRLTGDRPERVEENRRRLCAAVGADPERLALNRQVHGAVVNRAVAGRRGVPGDGLWTDEPDVPMLKVTADCLPIALAGGDRVAMLHCGWRGLAGGIVERALATFDAPPAAALGPCIGRCCYEVGEEVLDAFADLDGVADGRMLDLRAVAEAKLRAAGVTQVEHVAVCTSCNPDLLFSHRRDDGVTGRQCGIVVRT